MRQWYWWSRRLELNDKLSFNPLLQNQIVWSSVALFCSLQSSLRSDLSLWQHLHSIAGLRFLARVGTINSSSIHSHRAHSVQGGRGYSHWKVMETRWHQIITTRRTTQYVRAITLPRARVIAWEAQYWWQWGTYGGSSVSRYGSSAITSYATSTLRCWTKLSPRLWVSSFWLHGSIIAIQSKHMLYLTI